MRIELKKNKISFSEPPQNDVPNGLLIIDKDSKQMMTDLSKNKITYRLPEGVKDTEISSIYLRIK